MSVFGGDSWAREAQQRKRRVDDLMLPSSEASSYKRLANGKYACLVCPANPILDTPLMLATHNKGSRHIAAESRLKERDLSKRDELYKRIALSSHSDDVSEFSNSHSHLKQSGLHQKPLIEQTRRAILETTCNRLNDLSAKNSGHNKEQGGVNPYLSHHSKYSPSSICTAEPSESIRLEEPKSSEKHSMEDTEVASKILADWYVELHRRQEKELKFTAAGWKRDCHGKWYRDENVEFDSDEEDPNIVLD